MQGVVGKPRLFFECRYILPQDSCVIRTTYPDSTILTLLLGLNRLPSGTQLLLSLALLGFFATFSSEGFAQTTPEKWDLRGCIDYALTHNTTLNQSVLDRERARLNVQGAQGARIPTMNFSFNQGFSFGRSIDPFSNQFITQNIRTNNLTLSTNWTFFNGLVQTNTVRQNKLTLKATDQDLEFARRTLVLNVTQAYLNVVLAEEQLASAERQIQTIAAQVDQTDKLVKSGRQAEGNLLQIKAQQASDRLTLTQRRNALNLAKLALQQQLEIPLSRDFNISRPEQGFLLPDSLVLAANQLYQEAVLNRPEIAAAKLRSDAAIVGQRVARGNYYPRLSLAFNLTSGYSSARSLTSTSVTTTETPIGYLQSDPTQVVYGSVPSFTTSKREYSFGRQLNDNFGQSLSLALIVPILNNLTVRTNVARADINLAAAKLDETRQRNGLRQEIEQAWSDAEAARASYRAITDQVEALQLAADNTKRQFDLGIIGSLDYLTSRNNLERAKNDLVAARYDYFFKVKVLEFYQSGRLSLDQ
jgi:outer membrane protein